MIKESFQLIKCLKRIRGDSDFCLYLTVVDILSAAEVVAIQCSILIGCLWVTLPNTRLLLVETCAVVAARCTPRLFKI